MNNKKEIKENDSQSLALANTVRVWEQPEDINKIESKKEIEDIIKEILDKAPAQQRRVKNRRDADKLIHSSYTAFLLLGTMALHDQFGFGGARLGKWIDKMNELKECYEKGLVSVHDLQSMIKNETGIEIKF